MARFGGWKYCKAIGYSRNQIESLKKPPFGSILYFRQFPRGGGAA